MVLPPAWRAAADDRGRGTCAATALGRAGTASPPDARVGGCAGCLGGALGPPNLSNHLLSGGKISFQVSFAVEGLLPRSLGVELIDGFVRGKRFIVSRLDRDAQRRGGQIHPAIPAAFPVENDAAVWSEESSLSGLYLDCAPVLGAWP